MPIYDYRCACGSVFDVTKTMSEATRPENCPQCGSIGQRIFLPFLFHGASVQEAEYNPAFGCIVKNKYHRQELAKRHDVVEVGNDFKEPDNIHKHYEKQREDTRNARWESV